ncbi:uncharacterized protein LOC114745207 isoform X2 [Neltuma alba]|uniref:uncharacterized protein LOC114745207 isoform X2 n=1 Tax=Neltuma alba TaxID=207710 RepID=UPI0010A55444|nr:uncharacterized protein LOC114745207 isoform X2 [Prosopis alba]
MYFMTPFMAKSLIHLRRLTISNCGILEEVVMTNEGRSEEEIIFESLSYLGLTCLSSFKSFCSGEHTFIFPSLVTLKVTGCPKMQNFSSGIIIAPFLKSVTVENGKRHWKEDLNTTIHHLFTEATREGDEGNYKESSSDITKSSQTHQMSSSTTTASSSGEQVGQWKPNQIADTGKQETHKLPSQSYDKELNEQASSGTERPLAPVTQIASSPSTNQEKEESQDSETQSSKNLFKQATTVNNKESLTKGTEEMGEKIERPLVEAAKSALSPTGVCDADVNETTEKPLIQAAQEAQRSVVVQDIAVGTQEIDDTTDKSLIQTGQDAEKLATTQNTEELHDSCIETQKICDTIQKSSIPAAQNVPSSTMIHEAALDPSPSQASEPMISSIEKSNIYRSDKGMIDIPEKSMPYLEAGVRRHPQVLGWLNTKRRRVFASSFFSLFAEVTHILRTTRRVDLTEDDRNYIRECCTALQGVGFDDSWISYVHGCIEECEDGEDLKRKVKEAEDHASNLKAQLESINKELSSVEESLVLLRNRIVLHVTCNIEGT